MLKPQVGVKKYNDISNDYYKIIKKNINFLNQKKTPYAFVRTYGCQQNVSDGEKIKGILCSMGFAITDIQEQANIIVFNTCAIREHAEDRVFGNVGMLKNMKKNNPDLKIILCGCMTEQQHVVEKIKTSYPFVDVVMGTNAIHKLPVFINELVSKNIKIYDNNKSDSYIYEDIPIKRDGKFKAWVPVMYGCNNFCSYCIVPYVRGRERSRDSGKILSEIKNLLADGYKEITLLGQNVNSYGRGSDENIDFPKLLKEIDSIGGEYRIRFMTSHPKDATNELIDVIAESKHICHSIHLPFQSGNNRILKAMNRRYTREKYLEIINYAKKCIPDISLTSDIIVGFPGESYDEFKDTLSLIQEVKFTSLFTFIYSPRKGTPAAELPDPVSREDKVKWLTELIKEQDNISYSIYNNMVGKEFKGLVESRSSKGEWLNVRTDGNITIEVEGNDNLIGRFAFIRVTEFSKGTLKGKFI